MLPIAHCPKCGERVRVPNVDTPVDVRCPWCGESFNIAEVWELLPPVLEIVGAAPLTAATFDEFSLSSVLQMHEEPYPTSNLRPSAHRGPRARKRQSPLIGFLKIAGGGIAGVAIALVILQSINRLPDLGFWPFRGPGTRLVPDEITTWLNQASQVDKSNDADDTARTSLIPESTGQDGKVREEDAKRSETEQLPMIARSSGENAKELELPDFATQDAEGEAPEVDARQLSNIGTRLLALNLLLDHYSDRDAADEARSELAGQILDAFLEIGEEIDPATKAISLDDELSLDRFVLRLSEQTSLLKTMLSVSNEISQRILQDNEESLTGSTFAMIGAVIGNDQDLTLRTAPGNANLLNLLPSDQYPIIKNGSMIILIGNVEYKEGRPGLSPLYAASIRRN